MSIALFLQTDFFLNKAHCATRDVGYNSINMLLLRRCINADIFIWCTYLSYSNGFWITFVHITRYKRYLKRGWINLVDILNNFMDQFGAKYMIDLYTPQNIKGSSTLFSIRIRLKIVMCIF